MGEQPNNASEVAQQYYNSSDADNFYFSIWGGNDIHVGMYASPDEEIAKASARTVEKMVERLRPLNSSSKVLDLGAGYGGTARYLAKKYGCEVTAVNISEVENERHRQMNKEEGLKDKVRVIDGNFENLDFPPESFDVVWSQDAILHSGQKEKVFQEVARVLKKGGQFIFTDPMQRDDADASKLKPIYDRLHLSSLGSPGLYQSLGKKFGFAQVTFEDHTDCLTTHYGRVLEETAARQAELEKTVSHDYIERMKKGLNHWVDGGKEGLLQWGIFLIQ